jgi:hypothetical protein
VTWEPTYKEALLEVRQKFDAVNLQGVWPNFPTQDEAPGPSPRLTWAAGVYLQWLEEWRRRNRERYLPPPREVRRQLLDEIVRRVQEQDNDDLALILSL